MRSMLQLLLLALGLGYLGPGVHGAPAAGCWLSQYLDFPSSELRPLKELQDGYKQAGLPDAQNCSDKLFHPQRSLERLPEWARLVLAEVELDRTVRVLQNLSVPQLAGKAARPLAFLAGIRDKLRRCILLKARAPRGASQAPARLRKRLQRIRAKSSQVSRDCLEKAAVLNLFRLLYKLVIRVAYLHTRP